VKADVKRGVKIRAIVEGRSRNRNNSRRGSGK
jgi:hypothetical protein